MTGFIKKKVFFFFLKNRKRKWGMLLYIKYLIV